MKSQGWTNLPEWPSHVQRIIRLLDHKFVGFFLLQKYSCIHTKIQKISHRIKNEGLEKMYAACNVWVLLDTHIHIIILVIRMTPSQLDGIDLQQSINLCMRGTLWVCKGQITGRCNRPDLLSANFFNVLISDYGVDGLSRGMVGRNGSMTVWIIENIHFDRQFTKLWGIWGIAEIQIWNCPVSKNRLECSIQNLDITWTHFFFIAPNVLKQSLLIGIYVIVWGIRRLVMICQ